MKLVSFSNIIVLSIVVLCVESTDSSGSSAFRGGEGRGDRGARGEATRRSYQGPTDYNQYPQTYSSYHPYQQYYPGHQQHTSYYPYFPHYTFPYSSSSSTSGSSGATASSGSEFFAGSFDHNGFSTASNFPFPSSFANPYSPFLQCPKVEDLTFITTLIKSSVCSGNDDDSYEITSSSFDLCGQEQLLLQTCANSKITTETEVPTAPCTVANSASKFVPSATAQASIVLEDILFSCEGQLAGLQKNDLDNDDELAVLVSRHSKVQALANIEADFCDSGTCCEAGWTAYEGSCYQVPTDPAYLTWTAARDACEARGAHLVVIQDPEENAFVVNLIRDAYPQQMLGVTDDFDFNIYAGLGTWIGYVRPFEGTGSYTGPNTFTVTGDDGFPSDTFRWVDGSAGVYENFCKENPSSIHLAMDNSGNQDNPEEFCVDILGPHCDTDATVATASRWNNKECHWPRHYVCEKESTVFSPSSDFHVYEDSSCVNHILTVDKDVQEDCKLTWSFKTNCMETEECGSAEAKLENMALTATVVPLSTSTLPILNH
mmetsp:Transcript_36342/g.47938  ORF Transcript_36342/g.47938 Transcript_36342/m.47938 type:complete len:544 (-) Transcript_36342:153-1784(-)|eukprot:CAMPEP_0117751964 /NCGR_PEP_ID=MMETSP0947-20121206/11307_1 /TAXON_ID=44440 /ORGANISM="Chattonella subsalsa, Strain CCMP2191" /LENGTH=543 /DNA_ID=CAMNT_0005570483 /DNA_START=94 /DNA_END=1725 /DNA_ORIENTATION=+